MKKTKFIFFFIVGFAFSLYCQTEIEKKNTIGLHVAPGVGGVIEWGGIYSEIGIDYSRKIATHWSLCFGFEEIAVISYYKGENNFQWLLTSLPVQLKFDLQNHFKKRDLKNIFYFKCGPSLDFFQAVSKPTVALGCRIGGGYEHIFYNGMVLSLEPFLKFGARRDGFTNFLFSISLGIGYKFF